MGLEITAVSLGSLEHHPGVLYSYKNDVVPTTCSRSFWLLHKSKKVWFRLDEKDRGLAMEPAFYYLGRRILDRGDLIRLPKERRIALASSSILWGQNLDNGWGRGPDGTNYYLHLWTRWSLFQPARCHPESFSMTRRPMHRP
jgi:hypothetical protein